METIKRALEAVQHIYLCEDEGMASGQPTKEDYLEARKLVAAALSELEGSKPAIHGIFPQGDECATSIPVPPTRHWKPHPNVAPDNEDYKTILASVRACAETWVPGMRLIGNVQAFDIVRAIDAVEHVLEGSKPKEPPRYVRSGPPVQMQDVLLACGELNERERVAVQWVLDKINELPEQPKEQVAEPEFVCDYDDENKTYTLRKRTPYVEGHSGVINVSHDHMGYLADWLNAAYHSGRAAPTAREKAMEEAVENAQVHVQKLDPRDLDMHKYAMMPVEDWRAIQDAAKSTK